MSRSNYCVGAVDIGGTKIAVGVVAADGTVLSQRSLPTAHFVGWKDSVDAIAALLEICQRESAVKLRAIGIGCTGPVDPLAGTVGRVALLPGWEGCNLVGSLAELTGTAVAMENDADAAALAELVWGSGRNAQRFLYVTVSTGIGTGFICDGELYRGAGGAHPEMGHHTIDSSGPQCYCGARGCWESLASGSAIERRYSAHRVEAGLPARPTDARSVFELARNGDVVAGNTIERFLHDLGTGLANMTTMLVPDVIALGGGVMRSMAPYLAATQQFVQSRSGEVPSQGTVILAAELQNDVGLAGAAAVAMARWK